MERTHSFGVSELMGRVLETNPNDLKPILKLYKMDHRVNQIKVN